MTCYRLILEPDLESAQKITDHSYPLEFKFEPPAPRGPDGRFKFQQGDRLAVCIEISGLGDRDPASLSIHSMNLLSCRSAYAEPGQFFNSIFRRDLDVPDSRILASGASTFLLKTAPPDSKTVSFSMTFPTRDLALVRPGDFSVFFMLSIAERTSCCGHVRIYRFIRDPEMCVEPSG